MLKRRHNHEVWKLQRPLYTSIDDNEILAYTEGNEKTAFIHTDAKMMEQLFGEEYKIYIHGHISRGKLIIDEILEGEQEW